MAAMMAVGPAGGRRRGPSPAAHDAGDKAKGRLAGLALAGRRVAVGLGVHGEPWSGGRPLVVLTAAWRATGSKQRGTQASGFRAPPLSGLRAPLTPRARS